MGERKRRHVPYEADTGELCYHPSMPGQRPRSMIYGCSCGKNVSCPVCGFGRGQVPCDCTPPVPLREIPDAR